MSDAESELRQDNWRFEYGRLNLVWVIASSFIMALVLCVVAVSHGVTWATVVIFLAASIGFAYGVLRVVNPIEVLIWRGGIKTIYWRGVSKEWQAENLAIRPTGPLERFISCQTVVSRPDGSIAFRVFGDLPGYADFPAAVGRAGDAVA